MSNNVILIAKCFLIKFLSADLFCIFIIIVVLTTLQFGNHGMVTAQQEITMKAAESLSRNIEVSCGFDVEEETPLWLINGSTYELFTVPDYFDIVIDSTFTLIIHTASLCLNDTTFQCHSTVRNQRGRVTRLIVIPIKSSCLCVCFVADVVQS